MKYATLPEDSKPRATCFIVFFGIFGFLSLLLVVFVTVAFPFVFQDLVNTQVVLTNGTLSFEQWVKPTPAIYKIATAYNITNPADVLKGKHPIVQGLGPYYFREHREKIHVEEVYDRELRFGEKKYYIFDSEKTNVDRNTSTLLDPSNDTFTTFNIAYIAVAYNLTNSGASKKEIREAVIAAAVEHEQTLFMTGRTVSEVVFGYQDKFLEACRAVMPSLPDTIQIVYNNSGLDMEATSRVNNGRKNISLLGQYTEWQGHRTLPWWNSSQANTVNGTEGLFFAPHLDKTPLTTWTDDLFRSSQMEFKREEIRRTLNTFKYSIPYYALLNATMNPLNAGFYGNCPSGLMNLTAAVMAPIFASKPSFLDGEDWLLEEVTGLPPQDRATMDTNIWVEPVTGALVDADKMLQCNMMLTNYSRWPQLKELREKPRYVPIVMIKETGGMDDKLVAKFKDKVFVPKQNFIIGIWAIFGFSLAMTVLMAVLFFTYVRGFQGPEATRLIIPKENDFSESVTVS